MELSKKLRKKNPVVKLPPINHYRNDVNHVLFRRTRENDGNVSTKYYPKQFGRKIVKKTFRCKKIYFRARQWIDQWKATNHSEGHSSISKYWKKSEESLRRPIETIARFLKSYYSMREHCHLKLNSNTWCKTIEVDLGLNSADCGALSIFTNK